MFAAVANFCVLIDFKIGTIILVIVFLKTMKQLFSMEVFVVKMKLQKLKEKTLCRAYMVLNGPVCVQI